VNFKYFKFKAAKDQTICQLVNHIDLFRRKN